MIYAMDIATTKPPILINGFEIKKYNSNLESDFIFKDKRMLGAMNRETLLLVNLISKHLNFNEFEKSKIGIYVGCGAGPACAEWPPLYEQNLHNSWNSLKKILPPKTIFKANAGISACIPSILFEINGPTHALYGETNVIDNLVEIAKCDIDAKIIDYALIGIAQEATNPLTYMDAVANSKNLYESSCFIFANAQELNNIKTISMKNMYFKNDFGICSKIIHLINQWKSEYEK